MTNKPRAIDWLEEQTGQEIPYAPATASGKDRHLSVRLANETVEWLEQVAAARGVKLSQLVRTLLTDAIAKNDELSALNGKDLAARLAADVAEVQRRIAS